jgi:hypothetical protein
MMGLLVAAVLTADLATATQVRKWQAKRPARSQVHRLDGSQATVAIKLALSFDRADSNEKATHVDAVSLVAD